MFDKIKVKDYMTQHPITMYVSDRAGKAFQLINENKIRHIPILDDKDEVVGLVSDRDLRNLETALDFLDEDWDGKMKKLSIGDVMGGGLKTIRSNDSIRIAASYMFEYSIHSLPVVDDKELKGIITSTDLFRVIMDN